MANERTPQAGDIFVLCDGSGRWSGAYEFVRFDEADPSHLIVRDRSTGELFNAPPGLLRRPAIGADVEEPAAPARRERITDGQRRRTFAQAKAMGIDLDAELATALGIYTDTEPVAAVAEEPAAIGAKGKASGDMGGPDLLTDAQRRMIFARVHELGMDLDAVRAATPHGSVSALTKQEARELIDRLTTRKPVAAQEGQGTATGPQLSTIEYLRGLVGFSDAEFKHWLGRRFKVELLSEVTSKALASRIIGGLSRMRHARMDCPRGGHGGHKPRHPEAGLAG